MDVPETLIANAYNVKEVEITFDAYPDRVIPARIKEIGTEASAGTRTFPVTLIFDQPEDITILPGMAGTAIGDPTAGQEEAAEPEFLLPLDAFFTADGKTHKVWVIDEPSMTVKAHEVTRGRLTAKGQYVTGLEEGLWVATAGANTLREGQKVKFAEVTRRSGERN